MPAEYQSPPGRHRHICRECGAIWEHADDAAGLIEAHTCPECGQGGWIWKYPGPGVPAHHDHHLATKESQHGD